MHEAREKRCAAREGPTVKSVVSALAFLPQGTYTLQNEHSKPDIRFEPGTRAKKILRDRGIRDLSIKM